MNTFGDLEREAIHSYIKDTGDVILPDIAHNEAWHEAQRQKACGADKDTVLRLLRRAILDGASR